MKTFTNLNGNFFVQTHVPIRCLFFFSVCLSLEHNTESFVVDRRACVRILEGILYFYCYWFFFSFFYSFKFFVGLFPYSLQDDTEEKIDPSRYDHTTSSSSDDNVERIGDGDIIFRDHS